MNIQQLQDYLNVTRTTELMKGSWVSLAADLPSYPLTTLLLSRMARRTSTPVTFTLTVGIEGTTARYTGVNNPVQASVQNITKRASVDLSMVDAITAYSIYEQELQGTDEEQLVDLVLTRKVEQLDQPLLSFREHAFCGDGGSSADVNTEIFGLGYWFPEDVSNTTALVLNGGGNPANFAAGAADLTVADAPRWAHNIGYFTKVSDDDLLNTLHEFRVRAKYFVPEGVRQLDSPMADRVILVQHPVFLNWARLQTIANDDLKSDVGMWRSDVNFMSTPVITLPAISEPDSPETPEGYGLLYDLDLNTLVVYQHSGIDYQLQVLTDPNVPDSRKLYRVGAEQLICKNREKNLVMTTDAPDLIVNA